MPTDHPIHHAMPDPSGVTPNKFHGRFPARLPGSRLQVNEKARKHFVNVVFLIYLLAIFEGSLRKWVVPQLSQYIFFIRDPFLIWAYFVATRNNMWPRNNLFLMITLAMGAFSVVLVVLQSLLGGFDPARLLLAGYGWRSYFLYIPLAFLIGAHFKPEDLVRFFKWTLVLSIPIAVLVMAQFWAPPNAPINIGIAADEEYQFRGLGLTVEHTRPMGPFSSSAGQNHFVASTFAIVMGLIIMSAAMRWVPRLLLILSIGAVFTCLALGGSRGAVISCMLVVMAAAIMGLVGRGASTKARAIILPVILVVGAAILYPIVFPDGYAAFSERVEIAGKAEARSGGLAYRALYGFIDFFNLMGAVPVLGYGLGVGGNAYVTLGAKLEGVPQGAIAETDWARHIVDLGPAFGLGFIVFRIAMTIWLARMVVRATSGSKDPMPLMLFSFVGIVLLQGQISGQGAINIYAWLFTGFCIAACGHASLYKRVSHQGEGYLNIDSSRIRKRQPRKQ